MKKVRFGMKPKPSRRPASPDAWVKAPQDEGEPNRQENKEPQKRLTIDIPVSLHKRVKSQCALQNLNMADVVREMLEKRFDQNS
jgi:hypothetical protein